MNETTKNLLIFGLYCIQFFKSILTKINKKQNKNKI